MMLAFLIQDTGGLEQGHRPLPDADRRDRAARRRGPADAGEAGRHLAEHRRRDPATGRVPSLARRSRHGGIAVAIGILLITIDIRADHSGAARRRHCSRARARGYLVLALAAETHPAASRVVLGIPARSAGRSPGRAPVRRRPAVPVLTIVGWIVAFVVPRTRAGRSSSRRGTVPLALDPRRGRRDGAYSARRFRRRPRTRCSASSRSRRGRRRSRRSRPTIRCTDRADARSATARCDALYGSAVGSDFQQFARRAATRSRSGLRVVRHRRPRSGGRPHQPARPSIRRSTGRQVVRHRHRLRVLRDRVSGRCTARSRGWRGLATAFVVRDSSRCRPGRRASAAPRTTRGSAAC